LDALGQSATTTSAIRHLPTLRTDDLDEARLRLGARFNSHALEYTRRERTLLVVHSGVSCEAVSFHRVQYGGYVRLRAPQTGPFYFFQVALTGSFRISRSHETIDVAEGQAYAVNPREPFAKDWEPQGEQLIVKIGRDALEEHARTTLGLHVSGPLRFHPTVVDEAHDVLISLAEYVGSVSAAPIRIGPQIADVVMSSILASIPNTMSEELAQPVRACAPYYVHRVEEAIDAAPLAIMSLRDMTRIAGVSMRTLNYGFQRFRDTTPVAYLRDRRLDLAKAKLMQADPREETVTSIALECGFNHNARFAAKFRRRFGRSPSSVLRFKNSGH
jgi:AraC-like DNA-binding protein